MDLRVEVAFTAGYRTPLASCTWVDVSAYVEMANQVQITRGRADELGAIEASGCSFVLDNRDGRFTPARASSPYYPNVRLGRPVRVSAQLPDSGAWQVRFTGYVEEWRQGWDGTDQASAVAVAASSRLARLGLSAEYGDDLDAGIRAACAGMEADYWPLTADYANALTPARPLVAISSAPAVTFAERVGPSATSASFHAGRYLARDSVPLPRMVSAVVQVSAIPASRSGVLVTYDAATGALVALFVDYLGRVGIANAVGDWGLGPVVCDGYPHHIAYVSTGSAGSLYVDGAFVATHSGDDLGTSVRVGGGYGDPLDGMVSHVALTPTAWSSGTIADLAALAVGGFAPSATGARLLSLAGRAGIPAAEVVTTGCVVAMAGQPVLAQRPVEAMREVETAEQGLLYDHRDGRLVLEPRTARYNAASVATLDMAAQQVATSWAPVLDRTGLVNDATVTGPAWEARVTVPASLADYGTAASSVTTLATEPGEPLQVASWVTATHAEPRLRVGALTVDVANLPSVVADAVLGADISGRVTVAGQPAQGATASDSYMVEGTAETWGPGGSCDLTLNVSPAAPWLDVLTLDSATYGVLDADRVAL